jgi:hypothetical protein
MLKAFARLTRRAATSSIWSWEAVKNKIAESAHLSVSPSCRGIEGTYGRRILDQTVCRAIGQLSCESASRHR